MLRDETAHDDVHEEGYTKTVLLSTVALYRRGALHYGSYKIFVTHT